MSDPFAGLRAYIDDLIEQANREGARLQMRVDAVLEEARAIAPLRFDFTPLTEELGKVVFPPQLLCRVITAPTEDSGEFATSAIQDAIYSCPTGTPLYLPPGRYLLDPDNPVRLKSNLTLFLDPDAVLVIPPNARTHYQGLLGEAVEDVLIEGGQIAGDRAGHDYVDTGNATRTHEWGMGIQIKRGKRVTLRRVKVRFCTGDGFSVSGEDIHLIDCVALYNRRQGASVYASRGVRIIRGEYAFTGKPVPGDASAAPGTKPMTGLDFEPDSGEIVDALVDGAFIHDNASSGVLAVSRSGTGVRIDLRLRNTHFARNTNPIEASGTGGAVTLDVQDCRMEQHSGAFGAKAFTGATIAFDRNTVVAKSPRVPSATPGPYDLLARAIPPGALGAFAVGLTNRFE